MGEKFGFLPFFIYLCKKKNINKGVVFEDIILFIDKDISK